MANWNETINIAGINRLYKKGDIGLQQLAKAIARKLQNTEAFAVSEPEMTDILCAFNAIDELARAKDFQVVMDMLFDFGDVDRKLWIECEGVNPQEHDEIPAKTRNPLEEDTKPQLQNPHHHSSPIKGPYPAQSGPEWVKHNWLQNPTEPKPTTTKLGYNGHGLNCICDSCKTAKQDADELIPMWDGTKVYEVGSIVRQRGQKFECTKKHSNIDAFEHSHNRLDDPWKFIGMISVKPFDPALQDADRLACIMKGKNYPTGRKFVHMNEDEFNRRLRAANIDPPTVPKDLYSYWKDSETTYQDWLMARWHDGGLTYREAN